MSKYSDQLLKKKSLHYPVKIRHNFLHSKSKSTDVLLGIKLLKISSSLTDDSSNMLLMCNKLLILHITVIITLRTDILLHYVLLPKQHCQYTTTGNGVFVYYIITCNQTTLSLYF